MTRWRTLGVALAVLASTACGRDDDATSAAPVRSYDGLYQGLCAARASATRPDAARQAFFDRAHQPIHELATAVAREDRAVAARLLEAKQAVERDLDGGAAGLAGDLDRLLDTTRRAIAATGQPSPRSCQETP